MEISIKEIEQNLKSLPKEFLSQVNDYIEFLKSRYTEANIEKDWADDLSEAQRKSLERGIDDIKNGRTMSHDEAKHRIKQFLAEKLK